MTIQLYNTLTRRKQRFEPLDPQRVTLYACGPTVYNYAHIGNARPAVIFDLLRQVLSRHYPKVVYARNITDVDDKINQAAADQGVDIQVISQRYSEAYQRDMAALGVQAPDIEPRATEHIAEIIAMVERLIDRDHAYEVEGHVLFSIDSFPSYGQLSGRDRRELLAGARVDVAPFKRNPGDFVLWKPSTPDQPGWDSPWGRGRPGWHIECSAMSAAHLGPVIDIHAGGQDLVFPHHENEIAQSCCAHQTETFARYWVHNGFVTVDGRKMAKSVGNTLVVHELLKQWPGEVLRLVLLSAHYRQPLDWSEAALNQAQATLDRLYGLLRDHLAPAAKDAPQTVADPDPTVAAALDDDLNTPTAMAALNVLARRVSDGDSAAELKASAALLGLLQDDPAAWFKQRQTDVAISPEQIEALIAERNQARHNKDFAEADRLRDLLAEHGILIKDGPEGTQWDIAAR